MKEINAAIKVQDIIDWFEDGEEVIKIEIDQDGWSAVLQDEAYGYDDTIYKIELEKFDYEEFEEVENYEARLNDCYIKLVEVGNYLIDIEFI
mgnify:CR=1 FL=1